MKNTQQKVNHAHQSINGELPATLPKGEIMSMGRKLSEWFKRREVQRPVRGITLK